MSTVHRRKLLFSYGSWDFCHVVELEGDKVTIRRGSMTAKPLKIVVPSDMSWTRFWKSIDEINVWNWLPEYMNPNILDGCQWSLELQFNGGSVTCEGSNAS